MSARRVLRRRAYAREGRVVKRLSRRVLPGLILLSIAIVAIAVLLAIFLPWIHERYGK